MYIMAAAAASTRKGTSVPPSRLTTIKRDSVILAFGLGWGTYEILIGGGRASVLTFVGGILLSPVVLRIDEALKRKNGDKS